MDGFFSFIGAAGIATILSFYGFIYVFLIASARGERAGLAAGVGLALGLVVFGWFPIVQTAMQLLQMTQFYQYVRIVVVILALIIALYIYLDFRRFKVLDRPTFMTYFRIILLGFLMHVITPLPLDLYNQLLNNGGLKEVAGAIMERLTGVANPFSDPWRVVTLPIVSFLVYWVAAIFGHWCHDSVERNDTVRMLLMTLGLVVFIGVAIYVMVRGITYDPTLFDKITNIGINRFLQ